MDATKTPPHFAEQGLISRNELAARLGFIPKTLYAQERRGKISPARYVGRTAYYVRAVVEAEIEAGGPIEAREAA